MLKVKSHMIFGLHFWLLKLNYITQFVPYHLFLIDESIKLDIHLEALQCTRIYIQHTAEIEMTVKEKKKIPHNENQFIITGYDLA